MFQLLVVFMSSAETLTDIYSLSDLSQKKKKKTHQELLICNLTLTPPHMCHMSFSAYFKNAWKQTGFKDFNQTSSDALLRMLHHTEATKKSNV